MKCPECSDPLVIPEFAVENMRRYHQTCIVKTLCCATLITTVPIFDYKAIPYCGNATEDNWGDSVTDDLS